MANIKCLTLWSEFILLFLQAYCISRLTIVPSVMRGILLAKEGQLGNRIQKSLRILIMSGEVFPVCLWETICKLLPETTILNLYGSTEVSSSIHICMCALVVQGIGFTKELQMVLRIILNVVDSRYHY